jgi:hypothetical protein
LAWLRAVGSAFVAGLDVRPPWGDGPRAALPPTPLRPVPTWLPGDRVAATDPTWAVAWVRAGDGPPMGPSAAPIAASPVDVLEDVLQRVRRGPPAWWSVPGATDERPDPIAAAVWGLLRCLRAEASGRVLGQFDPGDRRMTSGPPEPEARWRGHWEVPRIQRTDAHRTPIDVDATWVVTGASGAVASAATDHLLELGVRRFHLLSRSPAAAARRLGEAGAQVHVHSVDVADAAAVARAIAAIEGPVAVLHAAGITQPRSWQDVDRATLEAVCRAKVDGSIALATALAGRDVRAFVLPSSIAAVWGGRDLAPYAAANAPRRSASAACTCSIRGARRAPCSGPRPGAACSAPSTGPSLRPCSGAPVRCRCSTRSLRRRPTRPFPTGKRDLPPIPWPRSAPGRGPSCVLPRTWTFQRTARCTNSASTA